MYHVPNPETRDHLNKGIKTEAEECDRSVFIPKEHGDKAFDQVIENGNERQGVCPAEKGFSLGCWSELDGFHVLW
jgi:hypothetical protein